MTDRAPSAVRATLPRLGFAALAVAIFILDAYTRAEITVSVLYVAVVLLAARGSRPPQIVLVSAGCAGLTLLALLVSPAPKSLTVAILNDSLSILANVVTTFLVLRNRRAEMALHERASLLDLSHDTVFSRSMDNAISYWNRGAEELYGWDRSEALGKVVHELLASIFPAPLDDINAELLRTGRWEGEIVHTKRDGTRVVVASRWSLHRDRDGRPTTILETNNDITEQKRAQESLQQAQAHLARLNRIMLMGEMTASIAHEVNQPIAGVVTNANAGLNWLAAQPPNCSEVRAALTRIINDGNRASETIARVRALIKKAPPCRESLNINEIINEVFALTRTELQRNAVKLSVHPSPDLPAVPADRIQLEQVMVNLVMNAIEAMSGINERPRELSVSSGLDAADVFVEVRDTGPGLDPASQDHLFQAFYTTKADGMGMGLALSRSIVEAHGGRLWVEPNQPHGAAFRFTLPVDEPSSTAPLA